MPGLLNPFRAPEPLPILNPSIIVPNNGFPVVKGLSLHNPWKIILVLRYDSCCIGLRVYYDIDINIEVALLAIIMESLCCFCE